MTNQKWREITRKRIDGGCQKALFKIGARNQRYLLRLKTFELRSRSRQIRYNDWLVWLRKKNILIPTLNQNSMYHFLRDDGRNLNKVFIPMYDLPEHSDWENRWHLEISDRCELSNTKHSFLLYTLCFNAGLDTHNHPSTQVSWNGKRLNPPWKELSNDMRNSISRFLEPEIGFRPCSVPANLGLS